MFYRQHLCVFLVFFSFASGYDQFHDCQKEWLYGCGQFVTLTCTINKTSVQDKCVNQKNITIFKRDNIEICQVNETGYANCVSSPNTQTPDTGCWCEQTDSQYIFKFKFTLDHNVDDKSWTCDKNCFDGGGLNNPLTKGETGTCSQREMKYEACPDPEICVMFDSRVYCSITGDILFIVCLCTTVAASCGLAVTGYKLYVLKKKNLNCSEVSENKLEGAELAPKVETGGTTNSSNPSSGAANGGNAPSV